MLATPAVPTVSCRGWREMAVVTATEQPTSGDGIFDEDSREYIRRFMVVVDDPFDGALTVTSAADLPRKYSGYVFGTEFDVFARLRQFRPRRLPNTRLAWHVECIYRTPEFNENQDELDNPLGQPARISFGSEQVQALAIGIVNPDDDDDITKAFITEEITTSAGEPFDPPAVKDESRGVITIVRNEDTYDNARSIEFRNAVNTDEFLGANPRQAKVRDIAAERRIFNADAEIIKYWTVTYQFVIRAETWDLQLLDNGTYYFEGGLQGRLNADDLNLPSVKKLFTDKPGHPSKGNLDGEGGKNPESAKALFRRFRVYSEKSFGDLKLPEDVNDFEAI